MPLLLPLHGTAARHDLPLPFGFVVGGAATALLVSFVIMIWARRRPEVVAGQVGAPGVRLAALSTVWTRREVRWSLRLLAVLVYAVAAVAMFAGPDLLTNPAFGFVYAWIWVGLVPVSLLLGQVWRALNPVRTLHRAVAALARVDPAHGLVRLPRSVGVYPAATALLGFVWLELVQPHHSTLPVLRTWVLVWLCGALAGAVVFGRRWIAAAEPFEVYATTVSRVSWLTSAPAGGTGTTSARPGRRSLRAGNPLRHLTGWSAPPGTAAVVCVLLGATAFDSVQNTAWWIAAAHTAAHPILFGTAGLVATVLAVWVTFCLACWAMRPFVSPAHRTDLPRLMAPTVVPVAIGYAVAHYFSFLVVEGQRTALTMSDPLGRGWNLFGTAELGVHAGLYDHPSVIAWVQLGAILAGHIVGVVSAHERALTVVRPGRTVAGQVPMLVLMVCYTCVGLLLLFGS